MDAFEYMKKNGIDEAMLDAMAGSYEKGDYPTEPGTVYSGSHLDEVGKSRITVVYDASDTLKVAALAQNRGVNPSEIYRDALKNYLVANN